MRWLLVLLPHAEERKSFEKKNSISRAIFRPKKNNFIERVFMKLSLKAEITLSFLKQNLFGRSRGGVNFLTF